MSTGADLGTAYRHLSADAETVLAAWQAPDAEQECWRGEFLAQVRAHPDAVAKGGPPDHLTASCLILGAGLDEVLLTHHRKADRWFQMGGHLEPGDASLRAAAIREAIEESGIAELVVSTVPVHLHRHALPTAFGTCRSHLDVRYAARAPVGAQAVASPESHAVRWWPIAALPEDSRDDLAPLVAAALTALMPPRPSP